MFMAMRSADQINFKKHTRTATLLNQIRGFQKEQFCLHKVPKLQEARPRPQPL
jgi:hypothetical protein